MFTTLLLVCALAAIAASLTRSSAGSLLLKGWDPRLFNRRLAGMPPQDGRDAIVLRDVKGISGLAAMFRGIESTFGSGLTAGGAIRRMFSPALMLMVFAIVAALAFATATNAFAETAHLSQVDHVGPVSMASVGFAKIREMRQARTKAVADARAISDKETTEKRALTAEEQKEYDKHFGEAERLKNAIDREERLVDAEREIATQVEQRADPDPDMEKREAEEEKRFRPSWREKRGDRGTKEYRGAFARFISAGKESLSPDQQRALSVGTDVGGGFTAASEQFIERLIKAVDNVLWIRQLATVIPVPTAVSLGAPSLDADPEDADWTTEIATVDEDTDMAFGKRKLTPHPLAKLLKVSNDFLRQSLTGGEALVRDRLAYKNGVAQEKGFMTGSGDKQPLGIFTASADGVTTARDVSTGNTTTAPTFDGLTSAKYSLKSIYWDRARWVFHRDVLSVIAKLKDGNGQYLWRESVRAGEPDRLLNLAIASSEYAPNTLTTGQYVGALFDPQFYWIADAYDVAIKRLDELYAVTNQVGFISRSAVDGMPVLAEAFARVKLA